MKRIVKFLCLALTGSLRNSRLKKIKSKIKETILEIESKRFLNRIGLKESLKKYSDELKSSGIVEEIKEKNLRFNRETAGSKVRGYNVTFGGLGEYESYILYSLVRHLKPTIIVETGVCNGVSSYIILKALAENGKGKLYSIDLPEIEGNQDDNVFWEGKGGAAVPEQEQSGWIVPENMRANWDLRLGNSFEILPVLLEELGSIDMFIHDSEHSFECMTFEYETSWPFINEGGVLLSDDVAWNKAFKSFSKKVKGNSGQFTGHLGAIFK